MKINEYYRNAAYMNLNGSIMALVPAVTIVTLNLLFINQREIMLLTIPFLLNSFVCFQVYLFRKRQSIVIGRNIMKSEPIGHSLMEARNLLLLYSNSYFSKLLIYSPDGYLVGYIKKYKGRGLERLGITKTYALYNVENKAIAFFKVKGRKVITIEVYDPDEKCLGSFEKRNCGFMKSKKEWMDASGSFIGSVEGSAVFMDEHMLNQKNQQVGRLRRGWMPFEWSRLFPEPNTPVLTFQTTLSENDKLLRMSFLISEYFIER